MPRAVATTTGAPFAKLVDLGDTLVGAYAGAVQRQRRDYKTGDPATKADGKPALEEIIHFVAMPGTTAHVGTDDNGYTPIEPGDHVRYSVSGYKWGQIIEARRNLPAWADYSLKVGQISVGDVYTFRLVGWSAATDNATAAAKAGFTVDNGRIVMRTQEEKDAYVLARSRKNQSTGVGKDLEIAVRRIQLPNEAKFDELADELERSKPWEHTAAPAPAGDGAPPPSDDDYTPDDEEPF